MAAGRILIIGGSGFVSGTLARLARDQGCEVWTVTRGQKPVPRGVTALRADRKDQAAFKAAVTGAGTRWDLVVDCIGYEVEDMLQDLADATSEGWTVYYAFFARTGFTDAARSLAESRGALLVNLDRLDRDLQIAGDVKESPAIANPEVG